MKKIIVTIAVLMLWASAVRAQQAASPESETVAPEVRLGGGYYGMTQDGNPMAAEYQYLKSSPSGILDLEWDPLPHRLVVESYFLNPKDYFGEMDYSYRDTVVFNAYMRGLFHNLQHYKFGPDDPTTLSPSFTDLDPLGLYGIENQLNRAFVRFKTPDFPLHFYATVRTIDREGIIQQRFMASGIMNEVSQPRRVDWNTKEYQVGMNTHLNWLEADYSHMEKKFEDAGDKVLYDTSSGTALPHNLVPDLKSSSDTVKLHTSYSGRFVMAGTYSNGERENEDSGAKVKFTNTAGDLMYMPVTSVILSLRYRHFDQDATTPETVTATGLGTFTVLRDSISSKRDVVSAVIRYRTTDRLTLKGEYTGETTDRTNTVATGLPDTWRVPASTTKSTVKVGFNYRMLKQMIFRGDYSAVSVDNPAYATDPDKAHNARVAMIWSPSLKFNTMLSYGMVRESRSDLANSTLTKGTLDGGDRDAKRDQALASATVMLTRRSSLTASYAMYKNRVDQTVALQDTSGLFVLEPAVPYGDTSHVGSLALTVAPKDGMNVTGSASRSYSRGSFRLSGADGVTNVSGIGELSDLKVIDTVYAAGVEMQFTRYVSGDVRYQYRRYDDQIDDAQDGTMKLIMATMALKW